MMLDENMIVAAAFATLLALGLRPLIAYLTKFLDARSVRIDQELKDATRLREEAQHMMSEYERKCREIEQEAQTMLEQTKRNVVLLQQNAEKQLQLAVQARIDTAHQHIARIEANIVQEMQQQAIDRSLAVAQKVIESSMSKQAHEHLIHSMVSGSPKNIH